MTVNEVSKFIDEMAGEIDKISSFADVKKYLRKLLAYEIESFAKCINIDDVKELIGLIGENDKYGIEVTE